MGEVYRALDPRLGRSPGTPRKRFFVTVADDESVYAYSFFQCRSDLFLVEGAR